MNLYRMSITRNAHVFERFFLAFPVDFDTSSFFYWRTSFYLETMEISFTDTARNSYRGLWIFLLVTLSRSTFVIFVKNISDPIL